MARLTRLNVSGLADELAARIVEELDYVREARVQAEVAAAFTHRLPNELAAARAAGAHEPPGRSSVTVPAVYAATPRVLITRWLEGTPLSALLDGRRELLPGGWRELDRPRRSGPGRPAARARHLRPRGLHRLDARRPAPRQLPAAQRLPSQAPSASAARWLQRFEAVEARPK
jgi:hypothetical protein